MASQVEILSISDLEKLSTMSDSDYMIVFDSFNSKYKRISRGNLRLYFSPDLETAYNRSVVGVSGSGNGLISISRQNGSSVTANLEHSHDQFVTGITGSGNGTIRILQENGSVSTNLEHIHPLIDGIDIGGDSFGEGPIDPGVLP